MYAIRTTYTHNELGFVKTYIDTKTQIMCVEDTSGDKYMAVTPMGTVKAIVEMDGYKRRNAPALATHQRLADYENNLGKYTVSVEWVEF